MYEPRDLILDPLHEVGMRMPDAGREYPAEEIDVLAAVQVLHTRAVGLGDDDRLPALMPTREEARDATFASATITFLAMPDAGNPECR